MRHRAEQGSDNTPVPVRQAGTPISSNDKKLHNQIEFCSNCREHNSDSLNPLRTS